MSHTTDVDNPHVTQRQHPVSGVYGAAELARLQAFRDLAQTRHFQSFNAGDNNRLFFIAFDGTGNNRDSQELPETNVSRLERAVHAGLNESTGMSVYLKGPGTQPDRFPSLADTALGYSVETTAREGYRQLVEYAEKNPGVNITISGIGFSRGSATLAAFMNIVYREGIPDTSSKYIVGYMGTEGSETPIYAYKKYLVQPGEADLGLMVMYELKGSASLNSHG
jgi:hypothetical protein